MGPVEEPSVASVIYASDPYGFSVNGHRVPANASARGDELREVLARYLVGRGFRKVHFRSEWKVWADEQCAFHRLFESSGIEVLDFWVPVAFPPGEVEVTREWSAHPPCKERE